MKCGAGRVRLTASVSFMFREWPLEERFAHALEAGFDGVEVQQFEGVSAADIAASAQDAGAHVELVNVPSGDYAEGGPGLASLAPRQAEFRRALESALSLATALSVPYIHLGPCRVPADSDRAQCMAVYLSNVEYALTRTQAVGAALLVEAMNRADAPNALLPDLATAMTVLKRFPDHLGLLFDVYHVTMNGDDPVEAYGRVRDRVRHVQFSDAPGRHEPGTGGIDFERVFAGLVSLGYVGAFGAEYLPSTTTAASLRWLPAARASLANRPTERTLPCSGPAKPGRDPASTT